MLRSNRKIKTKTPKSIYISGKLSETDVKRGSAIPTNAALRNLSWEIKKFETLDGISTPRLFESPDINLS